MTLVLENPELEARLLEEAKKRGLKPEEVALETLREKFVQKLHHDADFLIGVWNEEQFQEFQRNTESFSKIDEPGER
jgi:hypothetical protein